MRSIMMNRNGWLCMLLSVVFASCGGRDEASHRVDFIAHAGGAIDGCVYTNSLQAVERSIAHGFRFIELDLHFTADSVLVAAHSWSDFNEQCGLRHRGDSAPLFADFASAQLYGRYSTLSAAMIDSVFSAHDSVFLVTDKISDAAVLERFFPRLKERMVVEAFSYDDYVRLHNAGYYRVLYSCMAEDMVSTVIKRLLLHSVFGGERVEWLALHTSAFENAFFKFVDFFCDYNAAVFTVNDWDDIPEEYAHRVKMVYTDTLVP